MSSNIRVFVQWKNSTVFAGEDIECTITFKNTALPEGRDKSPIQKTNGFAPGGERQRKLPPVHSSTRPSVSRNSSFTSLGGPAQHLRGHRPALSVQTGSSVGDRNRSPQHYSAAFNNGSATPTHKHGHGKSLSITPIGTDAATEGSHERSAPAARRPMRAHGRSASLQVTPGRPSPFPGTNGSAFFSLSANCTTVTSPGHRSGSHYSPRSGGGSPPTIHEPFPSASFPPRPVRTRSGTATAPNTSALRSGPRKPSGSFSQNFKFPATPPPNDPSPERPVENVVETSARAQSPLKRDSPSDAPVESLPKQPTENLSPIARILSGSSMNGTPRSSAEFYSQSNNSTETLASEYTVPQTARLLPRVFHQRRQSQLVPPNQRMQPEALMMGYAQVMGSFTLDGSLINQAPFEEVKRKGVVGGQGGGGVVGVERTKRESGLFGALGWSNIGESIGGLLGASEPSSIREMRGIASSKTVPLITTPQSILFVDLQLAPGDSRSYTYSFTLPRGLPPTHKGRSMKVVYHLTIGTQRPGSARDQQVKHVEIPFRVFGSVNSRGEMLGHDLMSPYIILRDQAKTSTVNPDSRNGSPGKKLSTQTSQDTANFNDFLEYVNNLLDRPRQNSSLGLLSPTETIPGGSSLPDEPQTMREAIDLAIMRSNLTGAANQSANRFEIARSGRRVAVIMLARPAYRLGETVSAVIDFTNADIPCYSMHVSLETCEKVDPAIALRSNASIYRVTRKVHASFSANALFAQRLSFSPTIPPSATPEFITSGVSLEWKIRVEFITPRLVHEDGEQAYWDDLLEEVESGDRGVILAAAERLPAESFEVMVPVRVYGAVGRAEADEDGGEGLPV
ncbi:hypothetical protein PMIN01_03528 [Paraphaeosphaeria minitans]|uniref:Rgp1-domain-containing protein n=1 Tax=Paraphaeosphaeria minitans TaxID=565426 RepID=A0A9P6GPN8_9PLEO|nr:hypothetical protein PMIN01_03528 [Paraphaeosphaeria minitans]